VGTIEAAASEVHFERVDGALSIRCRRSAQRRG
jgi:type II secretory ATPase GspE/PulE/Tfp pilus assembly ATPase PilB-like protein